MLTAEVGDKGIVVNFAVIAPIRVVNIRMPNSIGWGSGYPQQSMDETGRYWVAGTVGTRAHNWVRDGINDAYGQSINANQRRRASSKYPV